MPLQTMRIGFVVNPYAGMGGPLANKGSDNLVQQAERKNLPLVAPRRAQLFLQSLTPHTATIIDWLTSGVITHLIHKMGPWGQTCWRPANCHTDVWIL